MYINRWRGRALDPHKYSFTITVPRYGTRQTIFSVLVQFFLFIETVGIGTLRHFIGAGPTAVDITPEKDGGVLKEIKVEGLAGHTPFTGDKVGTVRCQAWRLQLNSLLPCRIKPGQLLVGTVGTGTFPTYLTSDLTFFHKVLSLSNPINWCSH